VDEDARTITMHRTGLRVVADLGTGAVRIDR
jgi:hypothetical protein